MTDARLREAERDQSPAGRARLLHERLRAGLPGPWVPRGEQELRAPLAPLSTNTRAVHATVGQIRVSPEGHETLWTPSHLPTVLELAAYCGDEAARVVVGRQPWPDHECAGHPHSDPVAYCNGGTACSSVPLDAWARGLSRWGRAVCVRAACAAARVALEAYCPCCSGCSICYGPYHAIEAAEAWLACPCEEHERACGDSGAGVEGFAFHVVYAVHQWPAGSAKASAVEAVSDAARLTSGPAVREAMQRALVTWALKKDPHA